MASLLRLPLLREQNTRSLQTSKRCRSHRAYHPHLGQYTDQVLLGDSVNVVNQSPRQPPRRAMSGSQLKHLLPPPHAHLLLRVLPLRRRVHGTRSVRRPTVPGTRLTNPHTQDDRWGRHCERPTMQVTMPTQIHQRTQKALVRSCSLHHQRLHHLNTSANRHSREETTVRDQEAE